jgi:formylmethanofuran dehydrogenase subunit C
MTEMVATLRVPLRQRVGCAEILSGSWTHLSALELAARPVYLERDGQVALGEIFELKGAPSGRIRFVGNLELADGFGAGLSEGEVVVEGNLGSGQGSALPVAHSTSMVTLGHAPVRLRSASNEA